MDVRVHIQNNEQLLEELRLLFWATQARMSELTLTKPQKLLLGSETIHEHIDKMIKRQLKSKSEICQTFNNARQPKLTGG